MLAAMSRHHRRVSDVSDVDSDHSSILADQDRPEPGSFSRQGSRTVFSRQSSIAEGLPAVARNLSGGGLPGVALRQLPLVVADLPDVEGGNGVWEPDFSPVHKNGEEKFYDLTVLNLTYKVELLPQSVGRWEAGGLSFGPPACVAAPVLRNCWL